MNMLSRETSPHANRIPAAVPPSRETGPRTNQSMKRLVEALKRFQKPEPTPCPHYDDDSAGSSTLYDLKESESGKARSTANPSACLIKSVTFNLPENRLRTPELEGSSHDADNSKNDKAEARLTYAAQLRKASDNVYMSNRKSMNLKAYIHATHRRTEAPALLDSGATENFISLTYAKWLKLSFKRLPHKRPLLNVDGTTNKTGSLKYYVDLQVQTGTKRTSMRFFLTDLGHHRVILGYPWFAANQPKIDWARGWIDTTQLPLILRDAKAEKPQFNPSTRNLPDPMDSEILYIGRITIMSQIARQTMSSTLAEEHDRPNLTPIPTEYRRHQKVFSEEAAQRFPELQVWDHMIELKPGAPSTLPGKIYALSQLELQELQKFIKEHLAKGYIRPLKSPYISKVSWLLKNS